MAKVKTDKQATITDYDVPAGWVVELNFFDITGEKSKTIGTSNKAYHLEMNVSKDGKQYQLYSEYGPTGKVAARDWRYFGTDREAAEKEFNSIKNSKIKKGYVEIDVAQRTLGSDAAKQIIKPVNLTNSDTPTVSTKPSLHTETARIISSLMGATNSWVIQTLKCPLGQLTNEQVDKGRACLAEAKKIISTKSDKGLLELTNQFYGLIPHNLGAGARGKMVQLLIDTEQKVAVLEDELDTLLDAKALGATLTSNSVYDQYRSLDTEFEFINHNNPMFDWLNHLVQDTRASNHSYLGRVVLLNAWEIQRNNERNRFIQRAQQIASECGRQIIPDQMKSLVHKRTDVYNTDLFYKANIIPLFHGTRSQNITGILKSGLLIRPAGVIITGAMYGSEAIYKSPSSSKSINYTNIKASYWAHGSDDRAFLFISDCALGKQFMAKTPGQYTLKSIAPYHSVWAKGGQSGVINDEIMLYRTDQHNLRYLLEFTCQRN